MERVIFHSSYFLMYYFFFCENKQFCEIPVCPAFQFQSHFIGAMHNPTALSSAWVNITWAACPHNIVYPPRNIFKFFMGFVCQKLRISQSYILRHLKHSDIQISSTNNWIVLLQLARVWVQLALTIHPSISLFDTRGNFPHELTQQSLRLYRIQNLQYRDETKASQGSSTSCSLQNRSFSS